MLVTKRNGSQEPINLDKIHKVIEWAAEGLDVSVSQVELNAEVQFTDGIKTSDIHATLVKSAADLISEETPDYQFLAARLEMFGIRKEVYGDYPPLPLHEFIQQRVDQGHYCPTILEKFSKQEIDELDEYLVHDRDMAFAYAGVQQLKTKYLIQNRTTGQLFESPQMAYIAIAMTLMADEPKGRMKLIKELYDALSLFKVSFPTPVMAGVRTKLKQFSSCVLIEVGDSLNSISAATDSVISYISRRAGIGINTGAIRALGSPIRGGEAEHTGKIPFIKLLASAVKSCSQGGVRGGAATLFYPFWHREFEDLIVLKNNRGVEENRERRLDYSVQLNRLAYTRFLADEDLSFFCPNDTPDLLDAFYADQDEFERLYKKYEADETIKRKTLPAKEAFSRIIQERASTGRIYIQHIDHSNTHSAFNPEVAPVRQSNLCLEITLPTEPVLKDGSGEIALCTLAAFNLGEINYNTELERLAYLLVKSLDNLLTMQDYPLEQAERSVKKYRPLGIGVINYANMLANHKMKYSDGSANNLTHVVFEKIQYWLLKASNKLAQELYPCEGFANTTYSQGLLPIDTYKKDIDEVHTQELLMDWETLRADIKEYGLRNATLTALMPSETSSQLSNATNGIEPPRSLVTSKQSKDGVMKQVVPDINTLDYETYWQMANVGNKGYLELVGIMQKFVDQSISANTAYNPANYENGRIPIITMLTDLLTAYKLGVKTLYYHNTQDEVEVTDSQSGCDGGACVI